MGAKRVFHVHGLRGIDPGFVVWGWKQKLEVGYLHCLAVIGLLLVNSASGTIFFVNPQATGATNGLSWSNAYRCLPESLRDAHTGDEIWVAAGTYFGNIVVPEGVSLYGGFSGNET